MNEFLSTPKIEKIGSLTPEILRMYEVSGQDPITNHSFERYLRDKAQDDKIQEESKKPPKPFNNFAEEDAEINEEMSKDKDHEAQTVIINKITSSPSNERAALIKQELANSDIETRRAISGTIRLAPKEERGSLIRYCLSIPDPEVQRRVVWGIVSSPEEERLSLILLAMNSPYTETRRKSLEIFKWGLSKTEEISLIKQGLESKYPDVQIGVVERIENIPENERLVLEEILSKNINQGLESSHPNVPAIALMIKYLPKEVGNKTFNILLEKGLGEELISTPLYEGKEITKESFSRSDFEKTGSETTLLGGTLKDKTIIRTIMPEGFIAWQKLYEDYNVWKNAGFDYVPIESIQAFKLNKDGLVEVHSGVLDLSLSSWERMTDLYKKEMEEEKVKIKNVLGALKVTHGHPHDGNFCLRFFRDAEGKPDFKRVPRLYLIDFDLAVSPEK